MPDSRQHPPRLTVELRPDQRAALNSLIPWGTGKYLWEAIIDDVIELLQENEETRKRILGAIITRDLKLRDFSRINNKPEEQ